VLKPEELSLRNMSRTPQLLINAKGRVVTGGLTSKCTTESNRNKIIRLADKHSNKVDQVPPKSSFGKSPEEMFNELQSKSKIGFSKPCNEILESLSRLGKKALKWPEII